jgi:hypothetical protein
MQVQNRIRLQRFALVAVAVFAILSSSPSHAENTRELDRAIQLTSAPTRKTAQYNYVMTGKVRLLLLWLGSDDVGGGYIRRGIHLTDPSVDFIEVLFGSDPAKAPRQINHWGAAIETGGRSSALFGFMKSAKTASADAAEAEISRQKQKGEHAFEAIVSVVEHDFAVSRVIPILSEADFNLHQLSSAQALAADRLSKDGPVRKLDLSKRKCTASRGFLHAVDELARQALRNREAGQALCYVHNARDYTLTVQKRSAVKSKEIEYKLKTGKKIKKTYKDVVLAQLDVLNHQSGEHTEFELLLESSGDLAGVPVQITYQPNFWFKVVLNLDTVR